MKTQDQEIEVSDIIVQANMIQKDKKRKHGIHSSSSSSGTKMATESTDHANVRVWVGR